MFTAQIIGNLGNDPEMRYSASGQAFLRFNVAANSRERNQNGEYEDVTTWVRVTVFGQRAETLANYLRKGSRVYVQGRLQARPWIDRENQPKSGIEILGDTVEFMSPRTDGDQAEPHQNAPARSGPAPQRQAAPAAAYDSPDDLDDLPF